MGKEETKKNGTSMKAQGKQNYKLEQRIRKTELEKE